MEEEAKNTPQVELINGQVFPENVKEEEFQITQKNNNLLIYFIFIILILGILGFLGWKYVFGEKIMSKFFPLNTINQVMIVPTMSIDQTGNWKTYRNEIYGFEFKYPNDFQFRNDKFDDRVSVQSDNYKEIPISGACGGFLFTVIFQGNDLQNRNTREKPYDFYLGSIKTKRIDTESNLEGFNCIFSNIFIPDEKKLTINSFHIMMTRSKAINVNLFNQILSTFKFVE